MTYYIGGYEMTIDFPESMVLLKNKAISGNCYILKMTLIEKS